MIGPSNPGAEVAELRTDTKRLSRLTLPGGGVLPRVQVYVDGNGSSSGDQTVRGLVYSAAGTSLLATGSDVVIHDGQAAGWVDLPLPVPLGLGAGDYILAVHAGGADRSARIYGDALATPVVNGIRNNMAVASGVWTAFAGAAMTNSTALVRHTDDAPPVPGIAASMAASGTSTGAANNSYLSCLPVNQGAPATVVANAFAVTPGETVHATMWGKAQQAGGACTLALGIVFLDATGAGTLPGVYDATSFVPTVGQWHERRLSAVVPAGAAYAIPRMNLWGPTAVAFNGLPAGTYELRAGAGYIGRVTSRAFDGNSPGCLWDGTQNASTSRAPQGIVNYAGNPNGAAGGAVFSIWGGSGYSAAFTYSFADGPVGGPPTCLRILLTTPAAAPSCIVNPTAGDTASGNVAPDVMQTRGYAQVVPGGKLGVGSWVKAAANAPSGTWPVLFYWRAANGDWVGSITVDTGIPIVPGQWTWVSAASVAPAGAYWATSWVGQNDPAKVPKSVTIDIRVTGYTHGPMAAAPAAPIYGGAALCDQLGSPNASPSIQWLVPEVGDTYADGPAASTGLTPAGAKLPGTLSLRAVVEQPASAHLTATSTLTARARVAKPFTLTVSDRKLTHCHVSDQKLVRCEVSDRKLVTCTVSDRKL